MRSKPIRIFIFSAAILILITGAAKIISGFGSSRVLQNSDPLFIVTFRVLFWVVGSLECGLALFCFSGAKVEIKSKLMAWLMTGILIYRLGLVWLGYHKPCNCLGNLTDALHISPQTADIALKIVLAYLLTGSYASLFWLWRQKHKTHPVAPSLENSDSSAA